MRTRITKNTGNKLLGFGSTIHIQKRNVWSSNDMANAFMVGVGGSVIVSTLAVYLAYKSYKYFHNNYEIVRKNKTKAESIDLNENENPEEHQSTMRPGGVKSKD